MTTRIHATVEFVTPDNTGGVQSFSEPYDSSIDVEEYRTHFEQLTNDQNPNRGVSLILLKICNHDDTGEIIINKETQDQECSILFEL